MTSRRHYPKAPITEALIDIRARLPESVRLSDLEALHEMIREDYPEKLDRNLAEGRFEVGTHVSASARQRRLGFLFKSADEKQVFQARLDGFTMSRLAPYERWEDLPRKRVDCGICTGRRPGLRSSRGLPFGTSTASIFRFRSTI